MKKIQFKIKVLECSQDFSHYKSMGIFPDAQEQLTAVHGWIWSNFELVQDFMVVLITCKNEEDPIKNEGARVFTTLYINFSDTQGQITLGLVVVSGRILNSSKLSCIFSLSARMKMIQSKMNELEWSQHFSHYKSLGIFQDAQGQLTLQSLVQSGPISNLFQMVWLSLLSARIKKIGSKMKALEWSQDFPHSNPVGAICCHGNQSSDPIWPKTYCSLSPISMMLQIKFDCDRPAGCGNIRI